MLMFLKLAYLRVTQDERLALLDLAPFISVLITHFLDLFNLLLRYYIMYVHVVHVFSSEPGFKQKGVSSSVG